MPHVVVKLHAGRTAQQKKKLAQEVTRAIMSALGSSEDSVSVAVEDVPPSEWRARVYVPEILAHADLLYKRPGY